MASLLTDASLRATRKLVELAEDAEVPPAVQLGACRSIIENSSKIREQADSGNPTVAAMPDSRVAEIYREIARKTAAKLATKAKDHSAAFPSIVIQNN